MLSVRVFSARYVLDVSVYSTLSSRLYLLSFFINIFCIPFFFRFIVLVPDGRAGEDAVYPPLRRSSAVANVFH
jgi:hypothetical protein